MKKILPAIVFFIMCVGLTASFGQAPNISYSTPQVYSINTAITPLAPVNTGGAVPGTIYGQVTTVAGSGNVGAANGTGTAASFNSPYGACLDANGNLYVADTYNHVIRKITQTGVVTTFAGSGVAGFTDATGTSASFNNPGGLAIDASGTIYVGDQTNNAIRKITPAGVVTTFAGSGTAGFADGTGTAASFSSPAGMAFDASGNLYVADRNNNRIRKVTPAGFVTTFAGSGAIGSANGTGTSATFNGPAGVAIDASGNFYIADRNNNLIRKITQAGVVTTFAGSGSQGTSNGLGTAASFYQPFSTAIDQIGNVFVADQFNQLIREITPAGYVVTLAGTGSTGAANGVGTAASFNYPAGIVSDGQGHLFVTETLGQKIREIVTTGYVIDKPLPSGLNFDPATGIVSGTPTVASPATIYTITAINASGSSTTTVTITVMAAGAPNISYATPQVYPINAAITPLSPTNTGGAVPGTIYGQVTTVAGTGSTGSNNGTGTSASFYNPYGACLDASGNLYVADTYNQLIRKITPAGVVSTFAGSGSAAFVNGTGTSASFNNPGGLAIDASGNIYVGDQTNGAIRKITPAGVVTTLAGNGTPGFADGTGSLASFNSPAGMAFDAAGNLYVADRNNNRIRKVTPAGVVTTFAGNGSTGSANGTGTSASFFGPAGVAIDAATGNFYIADQYNNQIRTITPAGVVGSFAGNSTSGKVNGLGSAASFYKPFSTTVDQAGNIFVADEFNQLIREITPAGYVVTLAGTGSVGSADGIGTSASFNYPAGIVSDGQGHLLVTETTGQRIRKIVTTGYVIDKPLPTGLSFDPATGIISGTPTVASPATTYTVIAYNASGSSITTVTISVIVVSAQTITFPPITNKVYGTADFSPGATASSGLPVSYSSSNTAVATIVGGNIHIIGVGSATITASQAGNSSYSAATPVTQTLTVTPATLTITADNKTKVYGSPNPVLTLSYSGFVYGETTAVLTTQATATTVAANAPVNSYQITPSGAAAANYSISYVIGTLTVTPAPLTVVIDSKTKTQGDANPPLTYTFSGFVNGDGSSSMSNFPLLQTTATTASIPGTYPITGSGAVNNNYTISYTPGTLTVLAAQTITFAPVTKTYGDVDFAFTGTASSGLPISYTGSNPAVATISATGAVHIVSAGTITVIASQSGNASYGAAAPVTQTLTVNPAPLTITAANKTRAYGSANPALTYTYTGFVNGETSAVLTTQPTIATTATAASNVGTYPITITGAAAANYAITNVAGTLTITQVPLTITADNQIKPYAQLNPPLTCTYTGFVNGDGPASMSSPPTLQTTATIASPIGNYPITIAGAVNPNYSISYVPGILSILLAQTITTFPAPPNKVYGAADFTLTATASSGLPVSFAGSNNAVATVSPAGVVHITGVGTITITASQGGNTNYAPAPQITQPFTVTPAPLTITADNQTKVYNTANPTLTNTFTGLVYGETPAVLTAQPTNSTTATVTSNVGTYPITASGAAAANYTINYVPGTLTITPAAQTITFNPIPDQRKGDPDITLVVSASSGLPVTVTSSDPSKAPVTGLTVKLLDTGTVVFTAIQPGNNNYLPATATQTLHIIRALPNLVDIHPIVTPNGDGINDILMIEGIEKYPQNNLTLVTRNGVKIYQASNYNNGSIAFAGYSNITGSLQQQGTYFYSLVFYASGVRQQRVGFIVLKY